MSNVIYEDGYYNQEIKECFLSQYNNDDTKITYGRIFKIAKPIEMLANKDLFDFNLKEINALMYESNPLTVATCRTSATTIRQYIDWAIEEGFRLNNINPLSSSLSPNWYKMFVDSKTQTVFSEKFIEEVINRCINYQDKALIRLLFEGLMGEGYKEILSLKKSDIDFEKQQVKLNRGNLLVSDLCIKTMQEALIEKIYYKKNGNVSPSIKTPKLNLEESQFVIRSTHRKSYKTETVTNTLVLRRFKVLREELNLRCFTPINVRNSGMLLMAYQLLLKKEKEEQQPYLEQDDYNEICARFGISKVNRMDWIGYNYYPYKRDFLNEKMIKKIYNYYL